MTVLSWQVLSIHPYYLYTVILIGNPTHFNNRRCWSRGTKAVFACALARERLVVNLQLMGQSTGNLEFYKSCAVTF